MNAYQNDILAQPVALRDTLGALEETRLPDEIRDGFLAGRWSRVVLTGMGSSYFALLPLYQRLMAAGNAAWLVETSELIYARGFITSDTLVIASSQSGASVETVRLLDQMGGKQTVIGVCNTAGSPLARRATWTALTRAGDEATVSCKTYVAALMAQCFLGDRLIQGPAEFQGWASVVKGVQAYLDGWEGHVARLKMELEGVEQVYLAGRGCSVASAGTGGLILEESVHVAAEGMSSAGFRHGPFEMVGPRTFVLVFNGSGETAALNRKLYGDVVGAEGRAALVDVRDGSGPFDLPACPAGALPVLEILPVQMMTLAFAALRNLSAGSFSLATKVTTTE